MRRAGMTLAGVLVFAATACPPPPIAPVAKQIAAGGYHTCVAMTDGTVQCWGQNERGQVGPGAVGPFAIPSATRVPGLGGVIDLTAGLLFSCAALSDGSAMCWGADDAGQLGDGVVGTPLDNGTPRPVAGVSGATAISAGEQHACAVVSGGAVACWGNDTNGELGDGTVGSPAVRPTAQIVPGVTNAVDVTAGASFTCALLATGSIQCWGSDGGGTLGDGTEESPRLRPTPAPVVGVTNAIGITAASDSACALRLGGGVACWGWDAVGQLGDGTANASGQPTPSAVVGLPASVAIASATGGFHSCALAATGDIKCWGNNGDGRLGNGVVSPIINPIPALVVGVTDGVQIDAGAHHGCVVRTTGGVRCWGSDNGGQLGDGTAGNPSDNPAPVDVVGI